MSKKLSFTQEELNGIIAQAVALHKLLWGRYDEIKVKEN